MKIMFNTYIDQIYQRADGGTIAFTKNFVKNFSGKKHELIGIILHEKKENVGKLEIVETRKSYPVFNLHLHYFNFPNKRIKKDLEDKALNTLRDFFLKEKPDILFLNGYCTAYWFLVRAAAMAKIPVVAVHHGFLFKETENSPFQVFAKKIERDLSRLSTKEVFLNDYCLKEFQKGLGIKVNKEKVVLVPYPYNQVYKNPASKVRREKIRPVKIGMVGRWNPIKNPQILAALAKEAKKEKKNWEFYLVSKLNEHKDLAELKMQIHKFVKVLPPMSPTKLKKFYQEMDLLILPSDFETFASVVSEAALQGRFTLVSPQVGWSHLYKKFALDNWIIDFKNLPKVVKRIEENFGQEVPKKLTKFLQEEFEAKKIFDDYEKLFKSIVKKKKWRFLNWF